MYYLFDLIQGTLYFEFFGRIFVNSYQSIPVNLLGAIHKGHDLDIIKKSHFGNISNSSGINIAVLMQREYFSVNIEIRVLLLNTVKNHIEIGFIFAL